MSETNETTHSLEQEDEHIKLAVDLIYLLESNNIDPQIALNAIQIVASDLKNKLDMT